MNHKILILLVTCSSIAYASHYSPLTSDTNSYDAIRSEDIIIQNGSNYELAVTTPIDRHSNLTQIIPAHGSDSIRLAKAKQEVHITANVNGRIMKNNFQRNHPHENYWEIMVKTGIIGGIRVSKREHRAQ